MNRAMEFWGVQVSSKPCKVEVERGRLLHVSQATLGELKKDNEPVTLYGEIEKQKFVLGVLTQNSPQLLLDLVIDEALEISHNWKDGSVHILGYQSKNGSDSSDSDVEDSSDEDKEAMTLPSNATAKPAEVDDDDSSDSEDFPDDETAMTMSNDSDEDEDSEENDEDDSEEEKPTKIVSGIGNKRPNADVKTPASKKAKVVTPENTEEKKEVYSTTPDPSKKGEKTPGGNKVKRKCDGHLTCGSCSKMFGSQGALDTHLKAKHSAKA